MNRFIESSLLTKFIIALAAVLAALVIFWLGTLVGYRQAAYSSRWADHYEEVFGGMHSPFGSPRGTDSLVSNSGAEGTVMAVNLPMIAVKNANEAEKVIVIGPKTVIRRFRGDATTTDIHPGDFLITVGMPDEAGRINATFIRVASTSYPSRQ